MLRQIRGTVQTRIFSPAYLRVKPGSSSAHHLSLHNPLSTVLPTASSSASIHTTSLTPAQPPKLKRLSLHLSNPAKIEISRGDGVRITVTGDFTVLGTDSDAYFHLDTDPASIAAGAVPYENPKTSGSQLRYGGRGWTAKDDLEAFSEMSKADEGPDGKECWGRHPEKERPPVRYDT